MEKTEQLRARLTVEMTRKGWRVTDLAEACDRTSAWLNEVMNHSNPRLETLKLMADALGVEPSKLLEPVTAEEYGTVMLERDKRKTEELSANG